MAAVAGAARRDRSRSSHDGQPQGALGEVERKIARWKAKGDANKRVAQWATAAIVVSSALVPVVILVSTEWSHFMLGKVVPSILAAISAAAAGWLQFKRPYEGWKLYRGYQHALETERLLHRHKAGRYRAEAAPTRVLVERLAEFERSMEKEWRAHLPSDSDITGRNGFSPEHAQSD